MSIHAARQVTMAIARAGGANGVASMPALRHGFEARGYDAALIQHQFPPHRLAWRLLVF
jgi:hypothetical protein